MINKNIRLIEQRIKHLCENNPEILCKDYSEKGNELALLRLDLERWQKLKEYLESKDDSLMDFETISLIHELLGE